MRVHRTHRHRWVLFWPARLVEAHICQTCECAYDQMLLFDPEVFAA
jgi:hypothetical protein